VKWRGSWVEARAASLAVEIVELVGAFFCLAGKEQCQVTKYRDQLSDSPAAVSKLQMHDVSLHARSDHELRRRRICSIKVLLHGFFRWIRAIRIDRATRVSTMSNVDHKIYTR
jgi:hypothetical protein